MDQHHPGDDPSSRVKVGQAEVEEVKNGKMDLSNLFERLKKLDD